MFSSQNRHELAPSPQAPAPDVAVCVDVANECLRRGDQVIALTPKAFRVLSYLMEHPGRLVTKDELLDAVWPDTSVSDGALKNCIRELRRALAERPRTPRFIETRHGRGYRLLTPLVSSPPGEPPAAAQQTPPPVRPQPADARLVAREAELMRLQAWWEQAQGGTRQVVFVTGELGIGKTTLVEAFVRRTAAAQGVWIASGQCVAISGEGEPYLPVLEALGWLCRAPGGERLLQRLHQQAPTWLAQMPALVKPEAWQTLQHATQGTTRERMLREMVEMLEALTAEHPLVLLLEDLQWSDYSTLDLISVLAQRRETARLLILGTFRPADVPTGTHPLTTMLQQLRLHRQCAELPLTALSAQAVATYLQVRFGLVPEDFTTDLVTLIHQHTEGNPLFMVTVVEELLARGIIAQVEGRWMQMRPVQALPVPETIRSMLLQRINTLTPEAQRVLEVASVVGMEFAAALVAAGLEVDIQQSEAWCEDFARRQQFLRAIDARPLPDGTVTAHYSFLHAVYREVCYERVTPARRVWLHRRIGERLEAAYGPQAGDIAAALAMHFTCGQDAQRAVSYRQQAAEKALQRFAYPEAATHLQQGLALLETLPETTARRQQTLTMLLALGSALQSTVGQGHPDVAHVYDRALALCQPLEHTLQHFRLLAGLRRFYLGRGQVRVSCKLGEQLLAMAEHLQKPELLAEAHYALGITCLWSGELARASAYLEQGVIPDMALRPSPSSFFSGLHPSVAGRIHMAQPLWLLGYADQALRQSLETLTMTRQLAHAHSTTVALSVCAKMHLWRGEFQAGQEHARATIAIAQEQGFTHFLTIGLFYRGWALAAQGQAEGLMYMRQGIDANHATSSGPLQPFFLALLAEAYGQQGQAHTGLQLLAEAVKLVEHTEARWIEAELYRLRGTLLLIGRNNPACRSPHCNSQPMEAEAERAFQRARAIAHDQGARALELRAVTHLSRLWQQQGKPDAARQLLTEVYGWFTEGFDTMDLREARTLLRALDGARPRVSEPCVASTRSATAGAVRQRA